MRKILFWVLFFLYWLTGINKIFGHWILIAIGVISFLFVGFVIIYVGYNFLRLMAGSL
ncbi:MAG: hypothetical protein IJ864_02990 [Alphaproteobacteria bacterium]|nr:hypothetical protein [Alphaproteobacteria bacterium]